MSLEKPLTIQVDSIPTPNHMLGVRVLSENCRLTNHKLRYTDVHNILLSKTRLKVNSVLDREPIKIESLQFNLNFQYNRT